MFLKKVRIGIKNVICKTILFLAKTKYRWTVFKTDKLSRIYKNQKIKLVLINDIWTIKKVPWDLQHDFIKHRGATYLTPYEQAFDRYYSYLLSLSKAEALSIPNDEDFLKMLYCSLTGLYIRRTSSTLDVLDLFFLKYVNPFYGCYDISKIEVNVITNKINFFTKNNDKITPEHPLYTIAKAQAVICLAYFSPGIGHSWVHFDFPCVMSAACYNNLSRDSILYKILGTHTRFTTAINYQALQVKRSTNNTNDLKGKLDPIKSFPFTGDLFVFYNSRRVLDFYKQGGEFHCPPHLDERIPYSKNLMLYYHEIKKFIDHMQIFIEKDLLAALIAEISEYFPVIKEFNPYDVLSTYIWQSSVLHSTDHYTYYQTMKLYGSAVAKKRIFDCSPETKLNEIIDELYVYKYKSFLETFVFFHAGALNNTMANLSYGFSDPKHIEIEKDFLSRLHKLEKELEKKKQLLCPLKNMAQSICF